MNKTRRNLLLIAGAIAVILVLGGWLFNRELAPTPAGQEVLVRWEKQTSLRVALGELAQKGVVRNASVLSLYARLHRDAAPIAVGTYSFKPGMTAGEILKALREPLRQMVTLRPGWIAETAKTLEDCRVCKADDFIALTKKPQDFQRYVKFHLPRTGTLEGYLYPDTYDLPPLLGAKNAIIRQLRTFDKKVMGAIKEPRDLNRVLTVASMVQLEVRVDEERPIVAGVIENRLKKGMRLEIDATSLYAEGVWKVPKISDLRKVDSPYNTYTHFGLPPGPICSPSVKSIEAAITPAHHNYLFYVARFDGTHRHYFAENFAQHTANIRKSSLARRGRKT